MSEAATPPAVEADTGAPATPAPAAAAAPTPAPAQQPPAATPTPSPAPAAGDPPAPAPAPAPEPKAGDPPPYKIPDAYKDKPWAAKIKSEEDLYKQIDNLTTLVGKKVVVPDLTKATDAEREEYYAQTRPKDAKEYQFGETTDPLISTGMSESLMKNGVSAVQANAIIKDYQTAEKALLAEQYNPDGYKASMEQNFGADWEKVTGATKLALNHLMNAEDNKLIDNLPNVYLGIIHRTLGNVVKRYGITETAAHTESPPGGQAPPDISVVRENLRAEIGKMIHRPHTEAEVAAKRKDLADTYTNDPRLQKKG